MRTISHTVTKLLSLLIYPLSLSLLLGALALLLLWCKKYRAGVWLLTLTLGWLYLCSTAAVADYLMGRLETGYSSKAMSGVENADAIVLLGGAARGHVHMGRLPDLNQHADRLVHAVALYRAGKSSLIVVSGGGAPGSRSEARQIRDLLQVMGVPSRAIKLEEQSRNTYDNAVYTARMLQELQLQRVLLVTSAFHMRRAEAAFRAQGVAVTPAPADHKRLVSEGTLPFWIPGAGNLTRSSLAIHEMVGYWVYRLQGKL